MREFWVASGHHLTRREPVTGDEHFEPVALKQNAHPFAHRLLIVNDQDAERLVHDAREAWRTGGNVTRNVVPWPGVLCTVMAPP